MKKTLTLLLALSLTLTLGACGLQRDAVSTPEAAPPTAEPTAEPTVGPTAEPTAEPTAQPLTARTPEMLAAYAAALRGIYTDHVYPDGTDCGFDGFGALEDNRFAVTDVDGDGADELIVTITTTYMAGMNETVYGYNAAADTLEPELVLYPAATYYDNGLVKADWSHNQGLAPNYWPYTVFRYNAAQDRYETLAQADGWERAVSETNYAGEPFPEELDPDGSGVVFFLTENDVTRTVSRGEYETWKAALFASAAEMTIPYEALSEENIAALTP